MELDLADRLNVEHKRYLAAFERGDAVGMLHAATAAVPVAMQLATNWQKAQGHAFAAVAVGIKAVYDEQGNPKVEDGA